MGNRQLANHNTDDIKFNLTKILNANSGDKELASENIDVVYLEHRLKLNSRLLRNSEDLLDAVLKLQSVHKKIMKTNEEVIRFNSSMIELSADVLAGKPYPSEHDDNEESLNKRLAQIEKKYDTSKRKYKKIMESVENAFDASQKAQAEINRKRETIIANRKAISSTRRDIDIFL